MEKENHANKKSQQEGNIIKEVEIKGILEESGIHCYEPEVLTNLSDYIENYTTDILNNASTFMKHAGRKTVDVTDVKLAIDVVAKKFPKKLPPKELIKLAHEYNKENLPECSGSKGLLLPSDEYTLTKCNYKLKSANSQFPFHFPMMDITSRQNQIMALSTMKNQTAGIPTVIRTSSGAAMSVNVPMNLTPQRIILKPQTPVLSSVICSTPNAINDVNKRLKTEETKK